MLGRSCGGGGEPNRGRAPWCASCYYLLRFHSYRLNRKKFMAGAPSLAGRAAPSLPVATSSPRHRDRCRAQRVLATCAAVSAPRPERGSTGKRLEYTATACMARLARFLFTVAPCVACAGRAAQGLPTASLCFGSGCRLRDTVCQSCTLGAALPACRRQGGWKEGKKARRAAALPPPPFPVQRSPCHGHNRDKRELRLLARPPARFPSLPLAREACALRARSAREASTPAPAHYPFSSAP